MTRIQRLRNALEQADVPSLLVGSDVNRRYLSGFTGSAGWLLVTADKALLLVDFRYVEQAGQEAAGFEVVRFDDFLETLKNVVAGLGSGRVGFEAEHASVRTAERLAQQLPDVEWVPTVGVVERLRGIKEPQELAAIEAAVALADRTFRHILDYVRPGAEERDVALEIEFFMRREGAEEIAFPPIVASGRRGALPHARPTRRRLEPGEFVILDFGAVVAGYCSDITRTVFLGEPAERDRSLYELVLRAQQTGVAALRPGLAGKEVDAAARRIIEAAGYGDAFGHGLGHGVGMAVHEEYPRLSQRGEVVLEPGMVTSVEPGLYLSDWGGIRIEDLVVVTEGGCRVLTQSPRDLVALGT